VQSEGPLKSEWLSEIWRFRELLYFLAWRDVKVRYKQAALGVAWAILQPLLTMIIFTVFFGRLAGVSGNGIPYPLAAFCALVPWTYFAATLSQAGNSLLANTNLITKVYFPRVLLPASVALGGLLDFLISASFLGGMMVYYRVRPSWALLLYPLFVLATMILVVGVSMLLAALNVRFRDVKYAIPFLIQIWFFVTPIIYPASFIPKRLQPILAFNPMSGIVEGFRASLFPGEGFNMPLIATSLGITAALFVTGAIVFRNTERTFADII
jgi:lipopolysaccharide transport system permease protein